MAVSPSSGKQSAQQSFNVHDNISVEFLSGRSTVCWTPPSSDSKGSKITFTMRDGDALPEAVLAQVRMILSANAPSNGDRDNPLSSSFARRMLEIAHISAIENCTIRDVILSTGSTTQDLKIENVVVEKSHIGLSANILSCNNVTFKESTLYIDLLGGSFDRVKIDRATTIAGTMGQTVFNKESEIHGYAIDLNMTGVKWQGPDTLTERLKGVYLNCNLIKASEFPPGFFTPVTKAELRLECKERNANLPADCAIALLKRPPINGIPCDAKDPLDQGLLDLGVSQTSKIGFNVHNTNGLSQYLIEIAALDSNVLFAPTIVYRVASNDHTLEGETTPITHPMMIAEVLKRMLDDVPPSRSCALPPEVKKQQFNLGSADFKVIKRRMGHISDLFTLDEDSGQITVL